MKHFLIIALVGVFGTVHADDRSTTQKAGDAVKEAAQDTSKNTKEVYRDVKDKTCTMVNGKMECAAKKAGHKIQNAADEIKDKANDKK